ARPVGEPGDQLGTFQWPGTGQIYSSARDMATFLAANLGVLPNHRPLQEAMAFAQTGMFTVNPRFTQGLAWQVVHNGDITFVDKNGGLGNTPTHIRIGPPQRPRPLTLPHPPRPPPPPASAASSGARRGAAARSSPTTAAGGIGARRPLATTAPKRLLRPLPRLRGRDREGACNKDRACALTPSPTLPRRREREHTEF